MKVVSNSPDHILKTLFYLRYEINGGFFKIPEQYNFYYSPVIMRGNQKALEQIAQESTLTLDIMLSWNLRPMEMN